MVQAYEIAIQKPETKVFPWWATKAGRQIRSIETRFKTLIDEEMITRASNEVKCKNNIDFLQMMLDSGGNSTEGIFPFGSHLSRLCSCNPRVTERWPWESSHNFFVVTFTRHKISTPFPPSPADIKRHVRSHCP